MASSSVCMPYFFPTCKHARNLERLGFANQVCNGRSDDENFQRSDPAFHIDPLQKVLSHDALERFRERIADLVLLVGREDVDDAVDGFCRAWRVQRSEHEMAGGCRRQCQFDRFEVAHFTDENDVGIFTQAPRAARTQTISYACRLRDG